MSKNIPAYLQFVATILTRAQALGLDVERDAATLSSLPENTGFVFVRVDGGNASLIIPKKGKSVVWCDSHIDWVGQDGYIPLANANGAVLCRIDPSEVDLDAYLSELSGSNKRASQRTSKATPSADMTSFVTTLKTLGIGPVVENEEFPLEEVDAEDEDGLFA